MEERTRKLQTTASQPLNGMLPAQGSPGSTLYVINLCASMAPIAHADKVMQGFESYRVYQVSRKEDGRVRYRLRLGFFADEAEAETALACVREHYPTAFAASLSDEDQRHTRGYANAPATAPADVPKPVVASASSSSAAKPASVPIKRTTPEATATTPAVAPKPQEKATKVAGPAVVASPAAPAVKPPSPPSPPAPTPSDTQRVLALKDDRAPVVELEWDVGESISAALPAAIEVTPAHRPASGNTLPIAPVATTAKSPEPSSAAPNTAELTLAVEPADPVSSAGAAQSNEPFHVAKGLDIPAVGFTLEAEPVRSPSAAAPTEKPHSAAKVPSASIATPVASHPVARAPAKPEVRAAVPKSTKATTPMKAPVAASKTPAPSHKTPASPPKAAAPIARAHDGPALDMDSTQTIRALTAAELDDDSQPKWFAVQLAVSEQTINLDTMPHLDIFSAYRLYSVATAGSGKILHHMRIGFFKEQVSADAVSGYLKTFFANPTVLRISVAEYNRFSEAPPLATHAAESKAKVIELASARDRSAAREVPVVTMEVTPTAASGRYPKPAGAGDTGVHKQLPAATVKVAAKSAAPSVRRSEPSKAKPTSTSGKHRTLNDALLEEARMVELSESAIRRLPKNSSLLSKLFGKK